MKNINLAIIYYSSTGTNYTLSQWAAEAAHDLGIQVKVLRVPELAPESAIESNPAWKEHIKDTQDVPVASVNDLEWADAIIFSVPTRYGIVPSQMKQFLDSTGGLWAEGKLVNKVVSAMCSAQNPHGGQEQTILSLYTTMYHWGAIVATPGYSDPSIFASGGNPYGVSVTVDQNGTIKDDVKDAVSHQVKRTITIASWVKAGSK